MKMKNSLLGLLIILLLALALVACGGQNTTNEAPTTAVDEVAEPVEEPVEEPTEEPTEEPVEEPTEEPAEEAAEEPTEEPVDEPTEEAAEEPAEEEAAGEIRTVFDGCDESYEGESIVFYQQAGLTGPLATILGPSFVNGTRDAVAAINENGGICGATIEIDLKDTQYDPEQELAAYEENRAATPPPMFVLTYASPATVILKERVNEDHIVNIAAGLNSEAFYVPRDGWTVGTSPIYADQFAGFLQWASDNWAEIKPEGAGDDIVVGVVGWEGSFGAGAITAETEAFAEEIGVELLPLETQPVSPTADVTGQLQNLVLGGANVIYIQSLGFGPAQVIGTLRALDLWDSVVVGAVNWAMNTDVLTLLGDATLAEGYYGVFPYLWWNDTDAPGVQAALEAFEAGGYPESDKAVGYLLSYGSIFGIAEVIEKAMIENGFDGLTGDAFFDAFKEMGTVSASGLFEFDVRGETRAPRVAQIRQAQSVDGTIDFVTVEDFFELPDMKPPAE
ncbi:MAG: ABC transporter substrate-binding protein [Anaerolineae bacterium]|nr:ABC transporter substrate-binding protein [Anaerolineae bacterium]